MRRLVVTAVVGLTALAGLQIASGALLRGTPGADRLVGTPAVDTVLGRGGNDLIDGRGGADLLAGGAGDDRLAAASDGSRDRVRCGTGLDVVTADLGDVVAADCEVVSRQLSYDTTTDARSQHATQVEPDSFSVGATTVAVFQSGRMPDGGAAAISFATTRDAGATWHAGPLPGLASAERGVDRVSDPVVAYDALHRIWLVSALRIADERLQIVIVRSSDGVRWGRPVVAAQDQLEDYDKEWLTCDRGAASPFRGSCYLAYVDVDKQVIAIRRSRDGGLTWSGAILAALNPAVGVSGPVPVVRPDGTLVIPFAVSGALNGVDAIAAVRSTDGGTTFSAPVRVSTLEAEYVSDVRAPALPSADVDAAGTVYVVWSDARFTGDDLANDVVLSRSRDGRAWSAPERIPLSTPHVRLDHFLPAIAVEPGTSGGQARLAVVAYTILKPQACSFVVCVRTIDAELARSDDAGATWRRPQRLDAEPIALRWLADGGFGAMLGDYVSVSWTRGRPLPVLALAAEPVHGRLREAIFATTQLPR